MEISSDTVAIVLATGLGPILAVAVTLWHEHRNSVYHRRLHVFRTLMATRKTAISVDHVNALNLVEVDFYGCKKVDTSWKAYISHLNDTSRPEDELWLEKKEKMLAQLLFDMGAILNFDIPAMEIFKGGYAPQRWANQNAQQFGALKFINDLAEGNKSIPMYVTGINQQPQQIPTPEEKH